MACYAPWVPKGAVVGRPLSCGQCHGCKLERSRQWGIRCMHEASLYDQNCFVTLTYRDPVYSLRYRDFQSFMKRLRARFDRARIRFFMAGEYGEESSRAHYHACLFNFDFPSKVYLRKSPAGFPLYRSVVLEELWPHGFSSVGAVSFESAAYVARYCMKKLTGDGDDRLRIVDPDTGEVFERVKEFARMSLKPGIGAAWLGKFKRDVYPSGRVVVNGVLSRSPRYYDKLFRRCDAAGYMRLCYERSQDAARSLSETAPDRLHARETVSKARLRKGSL